MRLAGTQHGVFDRSQAEKVGMSTFAIARRAGSGAWVRILPGVYRTAGAPESWRQKMVAGCLWGGDGTVVSHLTAARLHGLEGVPRQSRGEPIDLVVPIGTQRRAPGFVVHRSRTLGDADRTVIDGVPVTTLARTLADLAARLDQKHLAMAIDSGLARHGDIDVRVVRRTARRLMARGRAGTRILRRLLDERAPQRAHLDSALER
jgi:predicted transcriptional regulator of viral defense system